MGLNFGLEGEPEAGGIYSVMVLIDDISDVHRGAIPRLSIVLYSDLISLSLSLSLSLVP